MSYESSVFCCFFCCLTQDPSAVKQLVDWFWPAMMDALGKEPEAEVQSAMMDTICEIVELVRAHWQAEVFLARYEPEAASFCLQLPSCLQLYGVSYARCWLINSSPDQPICCTRECEMCVSK